MHLFRKYTALSTANRWDRWRTIFDLLEDRHVVPITEIIRETGAKAAVIEKDIETLSQRGLVKRTAKGGLTLESFHAEKSFEERSCEDKAEKSHIAGLAAGKYIKEGMSIYLDGSTTVQAIVPFIAEKKFKILTSGLSIIADLKASGFPGEIYCTGGLYYTKANSFVGEIACDALKSQKIDLAILGVEGVSSNMELMESYPAEAMLKQTAVENSQKTIVLAMPHKLNDDSLLTFATLKQVDALISTRFPTDSFTSKAKATGVRLECPADS